jgi:uncharacterized protein (DUF302 family)
MSPVLSTKIERNGNFDQILEKVTNALKDQGFGVLSRIDFHQKVKEKLGKEIPATVILGACHPGLAFEAYQMNPGVTNLMPCNVVLQEVGPQRWTIEFALAEPILAILKDSQLSGFARGVDQKIKAAAQAT